MSDGRRVIPVEFPLEFLRYIPAAVVRLGYLFPRVEVQSTTTGVLVHLDALDRSEEVIKEVKYQVYREKIYSDTLPLRKDLYSMLSQ